MSGHPPSSFTVALLGDAGSGKSSLVWTLTHGSFRADPPPTVPSVTFPPEAVDGSTSLTITDTAGADASEAVSAAARADAVVVCFRAADPKALGTLTSRWLEPLCAARTELGLGAPTVVLAGCASDELGAGYDPEARRTREYAPLMKGRKEVKMCLDTAAKEGLMVHEVFHFAHSLARYPVDVLIDRATAELTDGVCAAVKHVFRVLDADGDGLLSDAELGAFQRTVFKVPLSDHEIEAVKARILEYAPTGGILNNAVTEHGFRILIRFFLIKGSLEIAWDILRHFGYDNELVFRPERIVGSIGVQRGADDYPELSEEAKEHLITLFRRADKDKDEHLSPAEFESVLAMFPGKDAPDAASAVDNCPLWGTGAVSRCRTGPGGGLTVDGWLGMWHDLTLKDPRRAVASLSYVGMDVGAVEPLRWITEPRVSTHRNERSVFRGLVFGASGSGKTAFLRGLASKDFVDGYSPSSAFSVVHVFPAGDATGDRTLVLDEVCEADTEALLKRRGHGERLDIAVLLYDVSDPSSFAYAARVHQRLDREVPCLFVGTKGDLEEAEQVFGDEDADPETYCRDAGISAPEIVSLRDGASQALYLGIWRLANLPSAGNPYLRRKLDKLHSERERGAVLTTGLGLTIVGALAIGAYVGYRYFVKK